MINSKGGNLLHVSLAVMLRSTWKV